MAAIGNSPTQQAFTPAIDYFSGNGSTTAFTLSRPVASVAQVQVVIDNVAQNPSSAYTVSNNTITFTSAPLSGTNNIYVYYTSPITQVIAPSQGTVQTAQLGNITNIASGNSSLTLQTGSSPTTAVTVNTSQNVGIGTASPTGKLNVVTDNTHNGGSTFDSTGTTQAWFRDTDAGSNLKNWGIQSSGGDFNIIKANDDRASGFVTPVYLTTTGNFAFNSGYGSAAIAYGCRAWARFVGNGSVGSASILASGGISSVSKTATGLYTVNLSTTMPDVNYSVLGSGEDTPTLNRFFTVNVGVTKTTSQFGCGTTSAGSGGGSANDSNPNVNIAIFR
jgi:hypothetical protein